jgi:peptidoglycan LD-endopeptidase LytH
MILFKKYLLLIATILLFFGCGYEKPIMRGLMNGTTPHEKYVKSLQLSDFDQTVLGQRWIKAGEKVFKESTLVELPYHETGKFVPEKPSAAGIKFSAFRGEIVKVKVEIVDSDDFLLFTDIFQFGQEENTINIYNSDIDKETEFEVNETGTFLLRLQPELMKGGKYAVYITRKPGLHFPVKGKTGKAVLSFFTTPPHFHFGIYRSGFGAQDPFPAINDLEHLNAKIDLDESAYGKIIVFQQPKQT